MVTTLAPPVFTIGSWSANVTDNNGVRWAIGKGGTQGWYDGAGVRLNQSPFIRNDGAARSQSFRAVRTVVLTGWADAPSKQAAVAARTQFLGLFAGGGTKTLTVVDDFETRTMTVELGDIPRTTPWETGTGFDWQLTLSAADPRKYWTTPSLGSTPLPSAVNGLDWGSNLIPNATFDYGVTGWAGLHAATVAQVQGGNGTSFCAKVTSTTTGTTTGIIASSTVKNLVAATTYVFTVDINPSTAVTPVMNVDWFNGAGTYLSTTSTTLGSQSSGSWHTITSNHVAPASATQGTPYVDFGTVTVAQSISVDNTLCYPSGTSPLGLDWSTGGGLNWGLSTSSGTFVLSNGGTAESWPTFTLNGPLTNPVITNVATGQNFTYAGTLGAGDQVVITTSQFNRSVLLNGSADRRPYLTTAQWFSVLPGSTVNVQLSSSSSGDTGTLSGSISPADG